MWYQVYLQFVQRLGASSLEYWLDTCCSINATKLQSNDRFCTIKYTALICNTINSSRLVSIANIAVSLENFSQLLLMWQCLLSYSAADPVRLKYIHKHCEEINDDRKTLWHEKARRYVTHIIIDKEIIFVTRQYYNYNIKLLSLTKQSLLLIMYWHMMLILSKMEFQKYF